MVDIDIKNLFNCFFYLLNSGVTKFFYFSTIGKYNMIVLTIKIRFFIMGLILVLLMANLLGRLLMDVLKQWEVAQIMANLSSLIMGIVLRHDMRMHPKFLLKRVILFKERM